MTPRSEDDIRKEAVEEFGKKPEQLARDIIREANTLPVEPASEKDNLDIVKDLLKRIALHQLVLDRQGRHTNCILIGLSVFMAIGSLFTVLQFFFRN
jgi:hypothetical protein